MPYAAVNGLNMYYEVHGDGPPLLLLHGGSGSIPERWIPFFADCKRRIDEDLDEFGITFHCNRASPLPIGPVWRNKGSDHDVAGVRHQFRYFAHPPNIFDPVIW